MIAIDSEFQSLIPPLSDDEYERLEKSIVAEGVRDPIITWNGTIVDGHNRYHICEEHGIRCPQTERKFESRDAAKLFIIDNQLRRRNLAPAAIGLLKLEEKEIVARRAKERQGARNDLVPNLAQSSESGRTLDQLAKDIPLGRESLRKLDVIKRKAEEGDETAIEARAALQSGEKKSIHGAYVAVVGKPKQRKPEETVTEDGRRICVMCGEPINEGEAHPARPTVHKKCEQEYQRDWLQSRKPKFADDGRRICTICGEPIDDGEHYQDKLNWHYKCGLAHAMETQRQYRNPTIGDTSEVLTHDKAELRDSMLLVVQDMGDTLHATVGRYETMGVKLNKRESERILKCLKSLAGAIESIKD